MSACFGEFASHGTSWICIRCISGGWSGGNIPVGDVHKPSVVRSSGIFIINNSDKDVDLCFVTEGPVADVKDRGHRLAIFDL
jgi:hypothetical protein